MFLCCSKLFNDFPIYYGVKAKVKINFRHDSASSGLDWFSDLISSNNIQHCSRKIQWLSCSAFQHRTHFCPGALLFVSSLSSGAYSNGSPFESPSPTGLPQAATISTFSAPYTHLILGYLSSFDVANFAFCFTHK